MERSAGGACRGLAPRKGNFPPAAPTAMPEPWAGAVGGRRGREESRKGNHGGRSGEVDEPHLAHLASPCPTAVTISHYGSPTMEMRSLSPKLAPGVHGRAGMVPRVSGEAGAAVPRGQAGYRQLGMGDPSVWSAPGGCTGWVCWGLVNLWWYLMARDREGMEINVYGE